MNAEDSHEHYEGEGIAYERSTQAYLAALSEEKRDEGAYERAYARAVAAMEQNHGRTSPEALRALYHFARCKNRPRDWLEVIDREREAYGPVSSDAAGTLGWMADLFDGSDSRSRACYRWAMAMERAADGVEVSLAVYAEALAVEGFSPLTAADVATRVDLLFQEASKAKPEVMAELARATAEVLEEGGESSCVGALLFLGKPAKAAEFLEKLSAYDAKGAAQLLKNAKKYKNMKLKKPGAKGHPLFRARGVLMDGEPGAMEHALTALREIPPEPAFLLGESERLYVELLLTSAEKGDREEAETRLRAQNNAWALTMRAWLCLFEGREEEGFELLKGSSGAFSECDDPGRWEVYHACAAKMGQWDVLSAWLDELHRQSGLLPAVLKPAPPAILKHKERSREALLKELYGIDFPDDLWALWEVAQSIRPEEPESAFEPLELGLIGPYDVLAGRLDDKNSRPALSMLLHWRYSFYPPEYLSFVSTAEDRLSYGYWLDDWSSEGVSSRFVAWSDEWQPLGRHASDVIRFELERAVSAFMDEYEEANASQRRSLERSAKDMFLYIDRARDLLAQAGGNNNGRVGESYLEYLRGGVSSARMGIALGQSPDFAMGIACELGKAKPEEIQVPADTAGAFKQGKEALAQGRYEEALLCGNFLWRHGGKAADAKAFALMDGAYAGLGREGLRRVLSLHHAQRWLPTVDIFSEQAQGKKGQKVPARGKKAYD